MRRATLVGLLLSAALLGACDQASTQPFEVSPTRGSVLAVEAGEDSPLADTLARGLRLALDDPRMRSVLRDVLRDSPFGLHRIHVQTFLSGQATRGLRTAVAQALGRTDAELLHLLATLPELELVMPRTLDRIT